MEKKTKKKKKSKSLRRRIGIIAVGGLSLVLTVCLSVGATLAWFAGSTWASDSMYMGGPVYVEMAGRGESGATAGDGSTTAAWKGGDGNLDIKAATARTTGTLTAADGTGLGPADTNADENIDNSLDNILLPGQAVQIYSQARVYSTAYTTTVADSAINDQSSGANTTNTNNTLNGTNTFRDAKGRITTTTTSVLRAKFSINVEFDPSMGFNNFTGTKYWQNYPVQSTDCSNTEGTGIDAGADVDDFTWEGALQTSSFSTSNTTGTTTYTGRRDWVDNTDGTFTAGTAEADLVAVKNGTKKSIYKWKFVTESFFKDATKVVAATGTPAAGDKYQQMGTPFNGALGITGLSAGYLPFYGVWVLDDTGSKAESDAFYDARCNAYLQSYVEYYMNEYGVINEKKIGDSVKQLETDLNNAFAGLVNDSSDAIHDGNTLGFTVTADGQTQYKTGGTAIAASWMYVDPTIGNDTNTTEIASGMGGWWYLVADDGTDITTKGNAGKIYTVTDSVSDPLGGGEKDTESEDKDQVNTVSTPTLGLDRSADTFTATNTDILLAQLYEISPDINSGEVIGKNGTTEVTKMVSDAFPFVNGVFQIPPKSFTNVFANAKLTFHISFQALQAFFPYTQSIDGIGSHNALLGKAKALNIKNAIPIYNEAFESSEA